MNDQAKFSGESMEELTDSMLDEVTGGTSGCEDPRPCPLCGSPDVTGPLPDRHNLYQCLNCMSYFK
jgi:hypothetical protein